MSRFAPARGLLVAEIRKDGLDARRYVLPALGVRFPGPVELPADLVDITARDGPVDRLLHLKQLLVAQHRRLVRLRELGGRAERSE